MLNLTDADYTDAITGDQPVLIDFWADWCGPCHMMAPHFESLDEEVPEVTFAKVDVEAERSLMQINSIRSIPTLILFKDGEELARHIGAADSATLKMWLDASLQEA